METDPNRPIPSVEEIIQEMKARPEVLEYLKKYSPPYAEEFLDEYAKSVHRSLKYGPALDEMEKERPLQFLDSAERLIWEIQQKKLFNLQCLWRAEQIEVPGLECTLDFPYWENYIESCPFIDPITEEEVELYIEFLLQREGMYWDTFHHPAYQDYSVLKREERHPLGEIPMPEWYRYYDLKMGTGTLLVLPDKRGKKERFYRDIFNEHTRKEILLAQGGIEREPVDDYPWKTVEAINGDLISFAEKFDAPEIKRYLTLHLNSRNRSRHDERVGEALYFLQREKEIVSLEPHHDWRVQVLITVYKYICKKVAEVIPAVYGNYKMRMETGIGYPHQIEYLEGSDPKVDRYGFYHIMKDNILKGRALNGEPEDWDF